VNTQFPHVLKQGFDAIVSHLEMRAKAQSSGFSIERLQDLSPASYLERFEPAIRNRRVEQVVLLTDDFSEDVLTPEFTSLLCSRLEGDDSFSFHAFIGVLAEEHENDPLNRLKQTARRVPQRVEITELGMKLLLQGLFTNIGGLCRGLENGMDTIDRVLLFNGVDLTSDVLEFAHSYLRYDERLEGSP
jgi:hypothetical protein